MSNDLYQQRLMSAAEAAALIPSGARVAMGLGFSQPPALLAALADRARAGQVDDVRLYYLLSTGIAGQTVLADELMGRIRPMSLFHSALERGLEAQARAAGRPNPVTFIPTGFQQVPRLMREAGVDTLVCTVSPMDADGFFSFGINTDYNRPVSDHAGRIILEVNPAMPRVFGDCTVHVSRVAAVVENQAPLPELPVAPPAPNDIAIGGLIADMIDDGSTLQMGIGALPNAVCAALGGRRDLGLHTEMLTPGLVQLMQDGVITNARKTLHPGKGVFSFCMGTRATYDFLDGNRDMEAHPVDYVNDPAVIARNDRMVSVNATLQVDLTGACCSEHLNGRQFTASGGQLDFVRGAYASAGGRSIIACHSTAAKGTVSRVVARLDGPVTVPRNDVHIVVTEHGRAELKGKSDAERARALVAIADPRFREALERSAREAGLLD
ncbi:acetyl-CoA hydrolase/transferase C-terminal domain-containing protein [Brevundimonas sp.]|uniref:acetyl-CoA hydrolase/transferase family protein n=1 Tax=Brevundimonas sp. TaxID=1871086 RepID=UPI001210CAE8|nr:acetyl-CoA hydrolase/transferase C-terminal domain-containing protein [Brevundimonas sp.]TAJ63289.1 MAG: acetyl-CoA hydrolase/transferase family protein [Brevundimonas sp.]